MLANPKFDWKELPEIQVWRKHSKDGETFVDLESYGPIESIPLFEEALKHNEVPLFRGKFSKFLLPKHLYVILACLVILYFWSLYFEL